MSGSFPRYACQMGSSSTTIPVSRRRHSMSPSLAAAPVSRPRARVWPQFVWKSAPGCSGCSRCPARGAGPRRTGPGLLAAVPVGRGRRPGCGGPRRCRGRPPGPAGSDPPPRRRGPSGAGSGPGRCVPPGLADSGPGRGPSIPSCRACSPGCPPCTRTDRRSRCGAIPRPAGI